MIEEWWLSNSIKHQLNRENLVNFDWVWLMFIYSIDVRMIAFLIRTLLWAFQIYLLEGPVNNLQVLTVLMLLDYLNSHQSLLTNPLLHLPAAPHSCLCVDICWSLINYFFKHRHCLEIWGPAGGCKIYKPIQTKKACNFYRPFYSIRKEFVWLLS